ncbi:MAG: S8 family serine peptidase [Bacteroidota bacterium]
MRYAALLLVLFCTSQMNAADDFQWRDKIDSDIMTSLLTGAEVEVIVAFHAQADLRMASQLRGKAAKGRYVFQQVQAVANESQKAVRQLLNVADVSYNSFSIVNALYTKVDLALAEQIAKRPEVANLQPNPWVMLDRPTPDLSLQNNGRGVIEWGIESINATAVWDLGYLGSGVVIGGQDTGYDWEHPAIQNQYRGWDGAVADHNYHWHDAIREINLLHGDSIISPDNNPCGLDVDVPCDDHNHGTHTMGTMVGDDGDENQIGVAPQARWIGCRNMERGYGSPASYIECFDWFLAPTNLEGLEPDPDAAPHVISNSWHCPPMEGCNPDNFALMETAVDALRAAGVVVVVSASNDGPECSTVQNPATIFPGSFTVGAVNDVDTVANFSSRGPVTSDGSFRLKPNVVAPGVAVRSAVREEGYATWSGTSMASPHVGGAVALIISAVPELAGEVEQIETILEETATPMPVEQDCDPFPGMLVPNAVTGYGKINVLAAVERAIQLVDNNEVMQDDQWQVFPNPTDGVLWVSNSGLETASLMRIFAADGRLVQSSRLQNPLESVDLSALPAGLYTYQIGVGERPQVGRILIQK